MTKFIITIIIGNTHINVSNTGAGFMERGTRKNKVANIIILSFIKN